MPNFLTRFARAIFPARAQTNKAAPTSRPPSRLQVIAEAKGDGTRLVDIHKLAADIGIDVRHVGDLPSGIIAHLHHWASPHACFTDPWILDIADNLGVSRERLTIARMIMLAVFHHPRLLLIDDTQHSATDNGNAAQAGGHRWSANTLTPRDNTLANQLAIGLLFPEPLVRKLHGYGLTIDEIADDLQTTPEAVKIRLKTLNLITA